MLKIWITFSPIADITAEYYGIGAGKVNWLSIVFMIASVPFGVLVIWMLDNKGLKPVIHTGAWLNFIGAGMRMTSIFNSVPLHARYPLLMLGQCIAAAAQPFALFSPTKLAATWFPHSERAKANMISSMANPMGIMLANILSPIIVKDTDDLYWVLEAYFVPAVITLFLTYMGVQSSRPDQPPSPSAEEQPQPFRPGVKQVVKNGYFWVLAFSFGAGLALFTSLSTLIEQILCPRGYSDEFAGICGALLLGAGLVGAALASAFVDKSKKFEETAKFCFCVATLFAIVFAIVSRMEHKQALIALSICGLGMFGFAVYPVSLELSVESTFPVAEATSSGFLMLSGQVQSMAYILIMEGAARPMSSGTRSTCQHSGSAGVHEQDFTISGWVLAGLACFAALLLTACYKCDYKRLHAEQALAAAGLVPTSVNTQQRRSLLQYT